MPSDETCMTSMGLTESVTPFQAFVWSTASFSLGAFVAGTMSYVRGTKELQLEGIRPQTRAQFLPTALKAFGMGTSIVIAATALGWMMASHFYDDALPSTGSSSIGSEIGKAFQNQVNQIRRAASRKESN